MKKQKFHENLAKMAKFAEETSEQKIPELSGKIESVHSEIGNVHGEIENVHNEVKNVENKLGTVDDRLGTVDKTIGNLCTGIDCVKEDAKKYQTSQEALEKLVQERFQELGEKVQSLERPTFTCENCGEQAIAALSSYCPNCGAEIQSWSDESGEPIRGWAPYWKRSGRSTSQ
jgi:chromosome segregation ATPase